MALKLGRMLTYLERLLPTKSHDDIITRTCKITWQEKHYITNTKMLIVTKLGRDVIYHEGVLLINSNVHLVTWYCKITWQTKAIIYLLSQNYSHKTWQDCDLSLAVSTPKVKWPYNSKMWTKFTMRRFVP